MFSVVSSRTSAKNSTFSHLREKEQPKYLLQLFNRLIDARKKLLSFRPGIIQFASQRCLVYPLTRALFIPRIKGTPDTPRNTGAEA